MKNLSYISFAQYNEDIILLALLSAVKKGFYVDVGANYEEQDSVTKLFYKLGWNGVNIEPITSLADKLQKKRSRDITLNIGISNKNSTHIFREYTEIHGHSTFSDDQKNREDSKNKYIDHKITVQTLKKVLSDYKVETIHFLKIDVEGYEYEVVSGSDWSVHRPWIVCIESNHDEGDWRSILLHHRYKLFIQDGLNDYYISEEKWSLTENFAEKSVIIQQNTLKNHQNILFDNTKKDIRDLRNVIREKDDELERIKALNVKISSLSMYNQPLRHRITIAAKGISTDWLKQKFNKRT